MKQNKYSCFVLNFYSLDIVFCSLGSIGTAPVPSASIVLIITTYQTAFGGDVPYGIEFIFAIDWLIDRFRTMFNICGDTVVSALVASRLDEENTEEFLKKVEKEQKNISNYNVNIK